jgi:hypothetical protein
MNTISSDLLQLLEYGEFLKVMKNTEIDAACILPSHRAGSSQGRLLYRGRPHPETCAPLIIQTSYIRKELGSLGQGIPVPDTGEGSIRIGSISPQVRCAKLSPAQFPSHAEKIPLCIWNAIGIIHLILTVKLYLSEIVGGCDGCSSAVDRLTGETN